MRLSSVRARSLGPFRDFTLDLDGLPGPLVAVTGRNGAGKSTILELALPGALYRETPTRGTLVELATARDALLESKIVNGSAWTFRHLVDKVSGKSEAVVLDAAGASVLPDTKVRSFDAWSARHMPPPQVLYACMFAPQGAGGFLAAKPAERKATLLRVLGVEQLEAFAQCAKEHEKQARTDLATAEQRVTDERDRGGDAAAIEAELERLKAAAASADEKVAAARSTLEEGKALRTQRAEAMRENERRHAKREEIEGAIAKARQELKDAEERLRNNRAVLADAEAIRHAVAEVERLTPELAAARSAAERSEGDARRHADAALELDQRWHALTSRLERADEVLGTQAAIDAAAAALEGLEQAAQEAAGAVGVAEDALEDLQGKRATGAEERITPLRKALDDIGDAEDGCDDPCARLADVVTLARETLEADDRAVALARDLPVQVKAATDALRTARDRKAVADRKLADTRTIAERRKLLESAEADRAAALQERTELEAKREEAARQKEADVKAAGDHRKAERERAAALEKAREVAKKAEPLAKAQARIAELEPRVAVLTAELDGLGTSLHAAPKPEPLPPEVLGLDVLEGSIGYTETTARNAHAAAAVAAERLERARNAGARLLELESDRNRAATELADWTRLAQDLGKDGLQAAEIDAAGPELTELVNDLLHECHGPRFTVRVETQRPSADAKRMLEGCEVVVLDTVGGREAPGETFSGGERVIIGEALSLALSMLACRRAGLEGVTLVRDESGAALDPVNAAVYIGMLRRAAAVVRADKVLFVSHSPDVIDMADSRVEVG